MIIESVKAKICRIFSIEALYSPSQDEPNSNGHSPLIAVHNPVYTVQYKTAIDESWSSF
ncbi:hypothetical protein [Nostoc sp.]